MPDVLFRESFPRMGMLGKPLATSY